MTGEKSMEVYGGTEAIRAMLAGAREMARANEMEFWRIWMIEHNKTKHTPGPWWPVKSVVNGIDRYSVHTLRDDLDMDRIGSDFGATICSGIGDHTESRTRGNEKANANLIAAAPDMIDILTDLVARWDSFDEYGPDALDDIIDRARTAIDKAKGQA